MKKLRCKKCNKTWKQHKKADHPFIAWTELPLDGVSLLPEPRRK